MSANTQFDCSNFWPRAPKPSTGRLINSCPATKPARHHPQSHALFALCRRQADAPALCLAAAAACGGREADACPLPAPSSASTPIRSSTTICRRWTTTIPPWQADQPQGLGEGIAVLAGDALLTQVV